MPPVVDHDKIIERDVRIDFFEEHQRAVVRSAMVQVAESKSSIRKCSTQHSIVLGGDAGWCSRRKNRIVSAGVVLT